MLLIYRWCALKEEYYDRDLIVQLPETETVYSIQWLSIYCFDVGVDFGHIEFELNPVSQPVPPVIPPLVSDSPPKTSSDNLNERRSSIAEWY